MKRFLTHFKQEDLKIEKNEKIFNIDFTHGKYITQIKIVSLILTKQNGT